MDTVLNAPSPVGKIKDPCKRCKGSGRIRLLTICGEEKAPGRILICCHCGGDGRSRVIQQGTDQ